MARTRWAIRLTETETTALWLNNLTIECFRYAGILQIHKPANEDEAYRVVDLFAPAIVSTAGSELWAKENAKRMRTFGFFSHAVPVGTPVVFPQKVGPAPTIEQLDRAMAAVAKDIVRPKKHKRS